MGKHYTTEFELQILRSILNGEMSIRGAARFYNIPSNALVGAWLKRFEKSGIKGLIPRKPSGRPSMKTKYARMPSPPKTVYACLPGVNPKKIQRLMWELGLKVRSKKARNSRPIEVRWDLLS